MLEILFGLRKGNCGKVSFQTIFTETIFRLNSVRPSPHAQTHMALSVNIHTYTHNTTQFDTLLGINLAIYSKSFGASIYLYKTRTH